MTPQSQGWLERMKQLEPARLVAYFKAVLSALSLLGYVGLNLAKINAVSDQLLIIAPPLLGVVVWPAVEWLTTRWLRSKVASPATAEVLAEAVLSVEKARGEGAPVKVPLKATRAAKRVLKIDPEKVVNPL